MIDVRWFCAVLLMVTALAACGGDDEEESPAAADSGKSGALAQVDQDLEGLYEGTYEEPPTESPPAAPNKNVWIISCGEALESCSIPVSGGEQAAKAIGWDVTVFDSEFNPKLAGDGIRQAIADKADGIFLEVIDCPGVRGPLLAAKKAGIKIVAAEAADCDEGGANGEPLFDERVGYTYGDWPEYIRQWGRAQAVLAVAKTRGKAKLIDFVDESLYLTRLVDEGHTAEFERCDGCEIVGTVKFTGLELGPKLQAKAQQALLKYPQADAVHAPYDAAMSGGIAQAINASGRKDEIFGVGGEGYPSNMDLVRNNAGQDGGVALAGVWEGYHGIDTLNRLFQGEEQVPSGIGLQVYDQERNVPASGGVEPPVDFEQAYLDAWGVR
ncbi:MAG: ribose transport system substrate-binding protein [Thermoleophilaceae bacterium]|nr:ribose transport system substrate-binding protein [Thermoleophilaceae bacterium]